MTQPRFAEAQCGCMNEEYQCSRKLQFFTLLSVIIFTGARGANKRHLGYNYSYHWVQNSFQLFQKTIIQHYSSIIFMCPPFQPSCMPLLRVVLSQSVLFWCYKITEKLSWCLIDWQLSVPNVNGHANSYPLQPLWQWGLNLDLNSIEIVIIHLSVPKNYGFDTIMSDYFYRSLLTTPQHYGC